MSIKMSQIENVIGKYLISKQSQNREGTKKEEEERTQKLSLIKFLKQTPHTTPHTTPNTSNIDHKESLITFSKLTPHTSLATLTTQKTKPLTTTTNMSRFLILKKFLHHQRAKQFSTQDNTLNTL